MLDVIARLPRCATELVVHRENQQNTFINDNFPAEQLYWRGAGADEHGHEDGIQRTCRSQLRGAGAEGKTASYGYATAAGSCCSGDEAPELAGAGRSGHNLPDEQD